MNQNPRKASNTKSRRRDQQAKKAAQKLLQGEKKTRTSAMRKAVLTHSWIKDRILRRLQTRISSSEWTSFTTEWRTSSRPGLTKCPSCAKPAPGPSVPPKQSRTKNPRTEGLKHQRHQRALGKEARMAAVGQVEGNSALGTETSSRDFKNVWYV